MFIHMSNYFDQSSQFIVKLAPILLSIGFQKTHQKIREPENLPTLSDPSHSACLSMSNVAFFNLFQTVSSNAMHFTYSSFCAPLCSFIMDFFAEYRFRPMETYAWFLHFPPQNKAGHEMVKI